MHPVVTDDEEGRGDPGLGGGQDGGAVRPAAPGPRAEHRRRTTNCRTRRSCARINPDNEDERRQIPTQMPYIVIIIDEVGDLMMSMKKEVEGAHHPAGAEVAGGGHPPHPGHAEADGGRHHRPDQVEPAGAASASRWRAAPTAAWCSTRRAPTSCSARATCCSSSPARARSIRARAPTWRTRKSNSVVDAVATDTPNYDSELLNLKTPRAGRGRRAATSATSSATATRSTSRPIEIVIREQRGSTSLLQRPSASATARRRGSSTSWPRTASSAAYNGSNAREVLVTPEDWETRRAG